MTTVVGVRFREIGKIYTFDPGEQSFRRGDHVITETAKGVEYGTVVLGNYQLCEGYLEQPLRPVLRRATEEDEYKVRSYREKEKEALKICRQKAIERKLEMKIISAEYAFDDSKLLFFFTAEGRVDFRELVKDLAAVFHMRIELRQVGVRDETKIIGGMGPCGRALCCHSWLSDFVPVSIKMAKEQNLSLNPQKISGVCGRLMCCLKNEADTYAYLNSKLPRKGDSVELPDGMTGEVIEVNVLKQLVKVLVILENDEREIKEVPAAETVFLAHRKKGQPSQLKKDAMARREAVLQNAKEKNQRRVEEASATSEESGHARAEGQKSRREQRRKPTGAGFHGAEQPAREGAAGVSVDGRQIERGDSGSRKKHSGGGRPELNRSDRREGRVFETDRAGRSALDGLREESSAPEREAQGHAPRPRRRRRRRPEIDSSGEKQGMIDSGRAREQNE